MSTGESEIEDSFMLVGSNFDSPSKIKIQKTHLTIGGTMLFNSGGISKISSLKIASDLTAPSKLYIQNSKLTIGGKLLLNTGADIENSEMIVGSDVSTSTPLKLKDSNIIIGGNLKLTNQSDWLGANVKIVGNLTSPNGIKIQSSTIITKSTELGTLNLQKTKFCAEDFNVKQNLTLDKESEIYYLKTSTHKDKNNQIKQLSKAEFDVMCSYNLTIEDPILPKKPKQPGESQQKPNSPDDILWYEYEPKLEKVTYWRQNEMNEKGEHPNETKKYKISLALGVLLLVISAVFAQQAYAGDGFFSNFKKFSKHTYAGPFDISKHNRKNAKAKR